MVKLIIGKKGSGKTKKLIEQVNQALESTTGNVVCIEKGAKLTYDIKYTARLIDSDLFQISGFDAFYGFLAGLSAGNYDTKEVFTDGILKIGGDNLEELGVFLDRVAFLGKAFETRYVFTVSADESELPASVKKFLD